LADGYCHNFVNSTRVGNIESPLDCVATHKDETCEYVTYSSVKKECVCCGSGKPSDFGQDTGKWEVFNKSTCKPPTKTTTPSSNGVINCKTDAFSFDGATRECKCCNAKDATLGSNQIAADVKIYKMGKEDTYECLDQG